MRFVKYRENEENGISKIDLFWGLCYSMEHEKDSDCVNKLDLYIEI